MRVTSPEPPQGAPAVVGEPVGSVVDAWRDAVMSTGAPDTLLWSVDGVEIDLANAHPGGLARLLADGETLLSQLFREPASRSRALTQAAVLRAKELELDRERGLPGCYLAFGRAQWGDGGDGEPGAPVFLRRCSLRPVDVAGSDYRVDVDGGLIFNPALDTYLAVIHQVPLAADELVRMSRRGTRFDPRDAFAALDAVAEDIPGWTLSRSLRIATFHTAKVAAVNDFARAEERFAGHSVLGPWLRTAGEQPPNEPIVGEPTNPDEIFVLDADPAQVAVLEAARSGTSLVVDAGPGTGKSQTIVNLAADLARVGARTLILAPSRGARAAVLGRFEHLRLGHLVHEPVADDADWTSTRRFPAAATEPDDVTDGDVDRQGQAETLAAWVEARDGLHAHVVRMHAPRRPWGVSLDEIQSRLVDLACREIPPRSKVRLGGSALAALEAPARESWSRELTAVAAAGAWAGDPEGDPWWGADVLDAADASRVRAALAGLSSPELARLQEVFDTVFSGVTVPALPTLGHHRDFVVEMDGIRAVLDVFRLSIFEAPLEDLIRAAHGGSRDRWRVARALKGLLRPGASPEAGAALLERAREVRPLWEQVRGSSVMPGQVVDLARAQSAYDVVAAHVHVLSARLLRPAGTPSLYDVPMRDLRGLIRRLTEAQDRLDILAETMPTVVRARAAGLGSLVEDLAARSVPADRVADEVELVWWASVLQAVTSADPGYAKASGRGIRAAAVRFRAADAALQHALALGLARSADVADPPIWVVSPYAVGHLVPGDEAFDVVVVDEAGTVTAAQAAAALARAPQSVIVGDSRVLGPRPFTAVAGVRPAATVGASLLDVASRTLPVFTLPWHYRSHDPRLIAAVNAVSYAAAMRTFPAPREVDGLAVERIGAGPSATAAEAGAAAAAGPTVAGPSATAAEAGAAAAAGQTGEDAAAVAAVSAARSALVAAAAERALGWVRAAPRDSVAILVSNPDLVPMMTTALADAATDADAPLLRDDLPEPLTVLDLTRCAGETRDGIVLVVEGESTAGLDPRALTAALGCARARLAVLHTMPDGSASPPASGAAAPLLTALLAATFRPEGSAVSVLAADLARRLRARGLGVIEGYGSLVPGPRGETGSDADSRVELAVFDPFAKRSPMVAVELDGTAYARAGGVRMRERLRIAQLHRLGWRAIRVASVDLFRDPAREEARIVAALEGLRARPNVPASGSGESEGQPSGAARRAAVGPTTAGAAEIVRIPVPMPPSYGMLSGSASSPKVGASSDRPRVASGAGRPEQTRDDTDAGWGETGSIDAHDRWLEENRPPHWE